MNSGLLGPGLFGDGYERQIVRSPIYATALLSLLIFTLVHCTRSVPDQQPISVIHPLEGALFPADMASPLFLWQDSSAASSWSLQFDFDDGDGLVRARSDTSSWYPPRPLWEEIKRRSRQKPVRVTLSGYRSKLVLKERVSSAHFSFSTSWDSVATPIFFRAVTLPFEFAVHNMETIKWCLGDVSSDRPPRIVLENMPVCANCHSFTADGTTLAMDVDYANDKGSYIITEVGEEVHLTNEKVITWSDYRRGDGELTFGLLSQISPDGRYAISTVKDRSVFVPKDDLYYSQLFFPLKGILASYDRKNGRFNALPGASDPRYVQSNPSWSPDGRTILFARAPVGDLGDIGDKVLLTPEQCEKYISRRELFKFDLYSVPFNDGQGGEAVPLPGASNNGQSNYFARYSPDGRWIVFCRASSFMLLQPDSRLFIMPAGGGTPREMSCNTGRMNSWHSWSPNGRWLVFSSKTFSPYTQLLLAHVDEQGRDSPPVLLSNFVLPDLAANIPEFANIEPGELHRLREDFIDYYSYKRMAYEKIGVDDEKAEQFLRESLRLNPEYATTHNLLGSLLRSQRRYEEAEQQFRAALELDPDDPVYLINLGTVEITRSDFEAAERAFEDALRSDPENASALAGLGEVAAARGQVDRAESYYRRSLRSDPENPAVYTKLGNILAMRGETASARQQFERALTYSSKDPAIFNSFGTLLLQMRDYEEAKRAFESAIELDSRYAQPLEGLGEVALAQGDTAAAVDFFQRSIVIDPDYPFAYRELGRVHMAQKDFPRAEALFRRALERFPDDAELHLHLGRLALIRGSAEEAEARFRAVLRADPDNPHVSLMLARALAAGGRGSEEAIALYQKALKRAPSAMGYIELGNLCLKSGRRDDAVAAFERALTLQPGDDNLRSYLQGLKNRP